MKPVRPAGANKRTSLKRAGHARKDALMVRAREVAKAGGCTGWKSVFDVVERDVPQSEHGTLRIWSTATDRSELDRLCEKARYRLWEAEAGRGGRAMPRRRQKS